MAAMPCDLSGGMQHTRMQLTSAGRACEDMHEGAGSGDKERKRRQGAFVLLLTVDSVDGERRCSSKPSDDGFARRRAGVWLTETFQLPSDPAPVRVLQPCIVRAPRVLHPSAPVRYLPDELHPDFPQRLLHRQRHRMRHATIRGGAEAEWLSWA
jgi:hypothetical protein